MIYPTCGHEGALPAALVCPKCWTEIIERDRAQRDRAQRDRRDLIEAVDKMIRIYNTFVGTDDVPLSIYGRWMTDTEKLLRRLQRDGVTAQQPSCADISGECNSPGRDPTCEIIASNAVWALASRLRNAGRAATGFPAKAIHSEDDTPNHIQFWLAVALEAAKIADRTGLDNVPSI